MKAHTLICQFTDWLSATQIGQGETTEIEPMLLDSF